MTGVDIDRLCRLNGMAPTTRERWQAFYRLWRAANRKSSGCEIMDAFRVLMSDWRWIRLVDGPGDYYASLRFMPVAVRRWRVKLDERLTF